MTVGSAPPQGSSGDIAMSIVGEAPATKANKESCCTSQCVGKTFIKVTIPSIIIGGLVAGAIFYGVTRLEAVLKDQIALAVSDLSGDLQNEITKITDTFNSIIASKAGELSTATSAAIKAGVSQLNDSLQTSFALLSKNLTEAIANATRQFP